MNDDIPPTAGAAGGSELQREELADCLSILKDIDRHLTHEHVAARFQELLGHVGWNTMPDPRDSLDRTASPRVNVARLRFGGLSTRQLKPGKPIMHSTAIPSALGERGLHAALSGETTGISPSQLPVAEAFAALCAAKTARAHRLAHTLPQPLGRPRRRRMRCLGPRTAVLIGAATAAIFVFAVLFVGNPRGLLQARTALCTGSSYSADPAGNPMASADAMPSPFPPVQQDTFCVFNMEMQEYKRTNARTTIS